MSLNDGLYWVIKLKLLSYFVIVLLIPYSYTQCGAVITRYIFSKIPTIDTLLLVREGEVWVSFVSSISDLRSAVIIAAMCIVSWNIGPCYNGTRLYIAIL